MVILKIFNNTITLTCSSAYIRHYCCHSNLKQLFTFSGFLICFLSNRMTFSKYQSQNFLYCMLCTNRRKVRNLQKCLFAMYTDVDFQYNTFGFWFLRNCNRPTFFHKIPTTNIKYKGT